MILFNQSSGKLTDKDGKTIAIGYSGYGIGKNNPATESQKGIGVIPKGLYFIGLPIDSAKVGKFALPLTPSKNNEMYGRSAFMIHGDSVSHPGTASLGCIIARRSVRELINSYEDRKLQVI